MRGFHLLVITVVSLTACSSRKLHWSDHRATTIELGGVSAPIPAGWRDAEEATDEDLKKLLVQAKGKVIVKEAFDGSSVLVRVGPTEDPGPTPPCEQFAKQLGDVEKYTPENVTLTKVAGDPTCRFNVNQGKLHVVNQLRFHGTTLIFVMCTDTEKGTVGAVCDQVASSLAAK